VQRSAKYLLLSINHTALRHYM